MKRFQKMKMRPIEYIVIHCSATCEDRPFGVADLARAHLLRGFSSIGYHYYILRSGKVVNTRPIEQVGAHAKGCNARSIGICYEGGLDSEGCPKDTRTPSQRTALRLLVHELLSDFSNNLRICGHRDLSPDLNGNGVVEPDEWVKLCPCFDVTTEL